MNTFAIFSFAPECLPLLVLKLLRFWGFWTRCIRYEVSEVSLVPSLLHVLDSKEPISSAASLYCEVSRSRNTSWISEHCGVSKTHCFFSVNFTRALFGFSCTCCFPQKWSYISPPCIWRLIEGLNNSQVHSISVWVCIGIALCLTVCWSLNSNYSKNALSNFVLLELILNSKTQQGNKINCFLFSELYPSSI